MKFKDKLKEKRWSNGKGQIFYKILWKVYNSYRFVADTSYRSRIIASIKYKKEYHQFSNFTKIDRYPDLFSIAQKHFFNSEHVKIMSFGCATGEEVFTLSNYLPNAHIIGVDINPWCIKEATNKYYSEKRVFLHAISNEFRTLEGFDAIFCLAVFQNPANRHNKELMISDYLFETFEKQVDLLATKLKSGGLLFIDQCDFNFMESQLLKDFSLYPNNENQITRKRPLFNRKNQKISEVQQLFRIFIKK